MYHFDFVGKRRIWFVVSAIVFVITVGSLILRGLNLGIDFTGGINLDLRFAHHISSSALHAYLASQHYANSQVVYLGNTGREVLIGLPALSEHARLVLSQGIARHFGPFTTVSLDKVTGAVSQQLVRNGILAVILATVGIILYMSVRFDLIFALSGILAVFYDALISIGWISLIHIQITEAFVPAVLTIIGYSINDRIIIFDRIRENLGLHKKEPLAETANRSLNQTLGRSINTAVIVILAMLSILIFGGSSLRDFSATTAIGVFFGAYSSIFLATPIWVSWMERRTAQSAASGVTATRADAKSRVLAAAAEGAIRPAPSSTVVEPVEAENPQPAQPRPKRPAPHRSAAKKRRKKH